MENKDYLTFTHPNCCDPALTVIERCFDGNANFLKVTVPGVGSSMVFEKATLIVSKVDNCNDTGCGLPFKGTAESPFLGYILLKGKMFYVAEAATGLSNNRFKNTLEVKFNNTTIDGNSYATTQELYDAIMAVVADCDCTCGDEVLPCDSIVSDLTWDGEGEEYQLIFHVGTSIGETVQLEVFNEEEIIAYTSEAVDVEEGATIVLPGESLSAISPGNTFRFYVRNGDTECFSDVPVVVGGEAIANNEEEIEVDLEDYFTAAIGACAGVSEYLLFYGTYTPGAAIVDGVLVIQPDETDPVDEIIGNLGLARICDGVLDSIVLVNIGYEAIVRREGLRMVFDDIDNAPVVDPTNVGQWNTFFDLPTNGSPFTSAWVSGNQVTLVGGGAMTIKASAFINDASLIEVEDQAGIVIAGAFASFELAASLTTPVFPEMLTAATECFFGCTSVIVFDLPKLQTSGTDCFSSCVNTTTFTLPDLTAAAQNSFWGCTSATTFTLPALLTTGVNCFFNCISCATFSFPLLKTAASATFRDCFAATLINIPLCVNLGANPADASVFDGCTNPALVLNIAAVNATNNGMSPHASIAALLIANPTATVNYI